MLLDGFLQGVYKVLELFFVRLLQGFHTAFTRSL